MKLLGWDTSSKSGAIVALEWDANSRAGWDGVRLVSEWSLDVDSKHSERLLWGVHQVLEASRWNLSEVDVFGVGIGPGSFTGLRIGVTTARTLSHTLGKPLVGVSSLAVLARPAALWLKEADLGDTLVIASTDACKGELFALWGAASTVVDCVAVAHGDERGLWKRGAEEEVVSPEGFASAIAKKTKKTKPKWMAVGEGRQRYPAAFEGLKASSEIVPPYPSSGQVQGRFLGMLAWEAFQAGLARDPLMIHPRYVRPSDAELKLRAGLLKKQPEMGPVE